MMIPIRTDAPIYHPPIGTFSLIGANIFVYIVTLQFLDGDGAPTAVYEFLCLKFGTINPLQWFTSLYMHAGLLHLIGNMIFLWTFGMIVEGKVGLPKFLLIYHVIGIVGSAIEQFIMLWAWGGIGLGASGAIFGLLAITMVWAPQNELTILWFILIRPFVFDATILGFALFTIGWELFLEILQLNYFDGTLASLMSSAFAHLLGAGLGFAVGIWMIKARRVDCEGYDLLTIWAGKEGERVITVEEEERQKRLIAERKERQVKERGKALESIQRYLDHGKSAMVIGRFNAWKSFDPAAQWQPDHLQSLIRLMIKEQQWEPAVKYIEVLVTLAPQRSAAFRLLQAEMLVLKLSRPKLGIRTLQAIPTAELNEKQRRNYAKLTKAANRALEEGVIEVEG